jgi:hypothetical protein
MLAKNLPPVEQGSWGQPGGSQLDRLLVSYHSLDSTGLATRSRRALCRT